MARAEQGDGDEAQGAASGDAPSGPAPGGRRRGGRAPGGAKEPLLPVRRRTSRRPAARRTAFVLSGGGNLGAVQVGELKALLEAGIRPDVVIGCSVGAINGVAIAADPNERGLRRLEEVWRRVEDFGVMPASWLPSPFQLARRGPSIHPNAGLRKLIEFGLAADTFEDLRLPFHCVATEIDTAEERWFSSGPIVDAILASAALPTVFPPVEIDGRRYLDGGIVNEIPLAKALELGANRVYVLHVGLWDRPVLEPRRPLDVAVWTFWLARRARYQRERSLLPPGVELVELGPAGRPSVRFGDFSRSAELVAAGYEAAVATLAGP